MKYLCMWFLQFIVINSSFCLRLKYLKIPYIYPSGHDAVLTCDFDMEGETLYAVKWFHNGEEFYRFSPGESPKAMSFPARGIQVDMQRATNTSVVLKDLQMWTTGLFRCEVLADAPLFQTITAEAFMNVGEFYGKGVHRQSCSYLLAFLTALVTFYELK